MGSSRPLCKHEGLCDSRVLSVREASQDSDVAPRPVSKSTMEANVLGQKGLLIVARLEPLSVESAKESRLLSWVGFKL